MARDGNRWNIAYNAYRQQTHNPLSMDEWKAEINRIKGIKSKKKPRATITESTAKKIPVSNTVWLNTHKEYLRWKKTTAYSKWRHKQFLRQGGTCYYCDQPLQGTVQNNDHVIPKILGGSNHKSNLVIACWSCNKNKYTTLIPQKGRELLKEKNRKKKGTYLILKEQYKTDIEFGRELGEMFKD